MLFVEPQVHLQLEKLRQTQSRSSQCREAFNALLATEKNNILGFKSSSRQRTCLL
jgi:hypothetical protein